MAHVLRQECIRRRVEQLEKCGGGFVPPRTSLCLFMYSLTLLYEHLLDKILMVMNSGTTILLRPDQSRILYLKKVCIEQIWKAFSSRLFL